MKLLKTLEIAIVGAIREYKATREDWRELCKRWEEESVIRPPGAIKVKGRIIGWGPVPGDELKASWELRCWSCGDELSFNLKDQGKVLGARVSPAPRRYLAMMGWKPRDSNSLFWSCNDCSGDSCEE